MRFLQRLRFKNILGFVQTEPVERIFLAIALPSLLFFSLAVPALQGWDEAAHFLRAYQISEGKIQSERLSDKIVGGNLPVRVIDMHDAFLTDLILSAQSNLERGVRTRGYLTYLKFFSVGDQRAGKEFVATATYSPVAYVLPATGIAIARTVHLPMVSYIYMARLFSLIGFMLLIYYAIKIAPFGKWLIFTVALLPQAITTGVTIGPDSLVTGTVCLLIALFARIYVQKEVISRKQVVLGMGFVLVLALTKQPYALAGLLFLLLPFSKFGSVKRYFLLNGVILGVSALIGLAWLYSVRSFAELGHTIQRPGLDIDPSAQVEVIIKNPFRYLSIFGNEVLTNDSNGTINQVTSEITWKGIRLPLWVTLASYAAIALAAFLDLRYKTTKLLTRIRIGAALIAVAIVGAVYTTLYIGFSLINNNQIEGINGRYFVAIIPFLALIAQNKYQKPTIAIDKQRGPVLIISMIVFILICTVFVMFATNYVPDLI